jgi:hypothetical protein
MELLLKENRKMASISNLTVLTVKRRYNLKKNSIYWSSHFRNIHRGIHIFHHHRRCHDHCIQCSCCTELITCEVIRKLLKDMNSKKNVVLFMSTESCSKIHLIQLVEYVILTNTFLKKKNKNNNINYNYFFVVIILQN